MTIYFSDEYHNPVDPAHQLITLCGQIAEFDYSSGISYRCTTCLAVIGSMGMPQECKEIYEADEIIRKLKGKK